MLVNLAMCLPAFPRSSKKQRHFVLLATSKRKFVQFGHKTTAF